MDTTVAAVLGLFGYYLYSVSRPADEKKTPSATRRVMLAGMEYKHGLVSPYF